VTKQITPETRLIFCVKFYTPDPGQLEEEYTRFDIFVLYFVAIFNFIFSIFRYLYALQIKKDLSDGLLLCSDATASLLASYILQGKNILSLLIIKLKIHFYIKAEIGDYNENHENNPNYFQNQKYFPHQNSDHELKIMDYHKNHM
jgi:FERM/RhoGEF/pleckstrin domain protein 2